MAQIMWRNMAQLGEYGTDNVESHSTARNMVQIMWRNRGQRGKYGTDNVEKHGTEGEIWHR